MVGEPAGQTQDCRRRDRQAYRRRAAPRQTGGYMDRQPVAGLLPYPSACYRGRAGRTPELPVFSPCSWPWQEAREQGVYGEFSFQRGEATAVNSLIPTALSCWYRHPSCPGLSQPTCLRTWHLLSLREPGYRLPRAPTAVLQFPAKPGQQGSGLPSPLPWISLRGTKGPQ